MLCLPQEIIDRYQNQKPTYHRVYCILRDRIMEDAIPNHTKLTEEGVAEALHVSRTPVHKALQLLKKEGIVQNITKNNLGYRKPEGEDCADLLFILRGLEGEAAALAAARKVDREELNILWGIYDGLLHSGADFRGEEPHRRAGEMQAVHDQALLFHQMLGRISGNRFLYEAIGEVHNRYQLQTDQALTPVLHGWPDTPLFCALARKLLTAVEQKNPESARLWAEALVDAVPAKGGEG